MFLNKRKRALALIITGVGLVTLTAKGSANTVGQSFSSIYNDGVSSGAILDNKQTFIQKCKDELFPSYLRFLKSDTTMSFSEYAKENNYDQDTPNTSGTQNINLSNKNTNVSSAFIVMMAGHSAKIKPGDMLVCHGTNSSGKFLGHEAIATSSNYVLEMVGPEGAKNNNKHHTLKYFYSKHLKHKGDYIDVYRIKQHPNYAHAASHYAFTKMYGTKNKINYLTTINLYHKNPSYCSKYVYLAYWRGNQHKGVKGGLHWVFPYSMTNVFKGTYRPTKVYHITKR